MADLRCRRCHAAPADGESICSTCGAVLTLAGALVDVSPAEPKQAEPSGQARRQPPAARLCSEAGCDRPAERGRSLCRAHLALKDRRARRDFVLIGPNGFEFTIADGASLTVGRSPRSSPVADLFADAAFVSRRHATFSSRGGLLFVRDHGSHNQTWVQGQPLEPEQEHPLVPGDEVSLGKQVSLVVK